MDRPLIVNGATIIQSGCHGSFVGRLDVEIDGGQVTAIHHQLIHVNHSIPADPDMERLVESIVSPHRLMLSEVVGRTETALNRNTFLESTMDNLLLQAVAEAAETRIAFSNGWRYGAPIPPGPVTVNDLWNLVPPNPPVSTVELTGQEMWDMIEDNLEHTFAADSYQQMGGYASMARLDEIHFTHRIGCGVFHNPRWGFTPWRSGLRGRKLKCRPRCRTR